MREAKRKEEVEGGSKRRRRRQEIKGSYVVLLYSMKHNIELIKKKSGFLVKSMW